MLYANPKHKHTEIIELNHVASVKDISIWVIIMKKHKYESNAPNVKPISLFVAILMQHIGNDFLTLLKNKNFFINWPILTWVIWL